MARKRNAPKPPDEAPVPSRSPEARAEDLMELLGGITSLMSSVRMKRVALVSSRVVADPDADAFGVAGTVSLEPPESEFDFDAATRVLRILCHCRLTAARGAAKGRKKEVAPPMLVVEATFLLDYEVTPHVAAAVDESMLDVFSDAALAHAWPYWREFVRDASTRAGLPVIDVPFDVEF
jgi:hypothetical protein